MHRLIACLRQLDAEHFTSGELIAERLGISRASVSTKLAQSEAYGVPLERRHGLGYRLQTPIEWLDLAAVRAELATDSGWHLAIEDALPSTNHALFSAPEHGQVLAAEWQSSGRGRRGRPWQGGLGGSLLFSLAWTFPNGPAQLAGLSLAVGVALVRALRAAGVADVGLKWPNDLLRPHGKIGGILIEMQGDAMGPAQVVIGVGLNLSGLERWCPPLDQPVAGLAEGGLQLNRNQLLGRCLAELERTLTQFAHSGFAPWQAEWERYHAWANAAVTLHCADGRVLAGQLLGVTAEGALRLAVAGAEQLIHAGELSLRKSP